MFYPISKFYYYINVAKRLYLARTGDNDLLKKPCKSEILSKFEKKVHKLTQLEQMPEYHDKETKKELQKHRFIHMSSKDTFLLFVHTQLRCLVCKVCPLWRKKAKLQKLYDRAQHKIESQLNLFKIMKNMRMMKIAMRSNNLDKNVEYDCLHSHKCIINLDTSCEESIEEEQSNSNSECN